VNDAAEGDRIEEDADIDSKETRLTLMEEVVDAMIGQTLNG
jgi:hypothetical protein